MCLVMYPKTLPGLVFRAFHHVLQIVHGYVAIIAKHEPREKSKCQLAHDQVKQSQEYGRKNQPRHRRHGEPFRIFWVYMMEAVPFILNVVESLRVGLGVIQKPVNEIFG